MYLSFSTSRQSMCLGKALQVATDMNKAIHHWEEDPAIGGNALARWVLGTEEMGLERQRGQ